MDPNSTIITCKNDVIIRIVIKIGLFNKPEKTFTLRVKSENRAGVRAKMWNQGRPPAVRHLRSPFNLRQLTSLNNCIQTKVLKIIV